MAMKILIDAKQLFGCWVDFGNHQDVCDSSHDYSNLNVLVLWADKGKKQSDFLLLKYVAGNALVIAQDYGLAVLVLAKKAFILSVNGNFYTE